MTNDGDDEMHFFFTKDGDDEGEEVLSADLYVEDGGIVYFTAGINDIYPNDMGL